MYIDFHNITRLTIHPVEADKMASARSYASREIEIEYDNGSHARILLFSYDPDALRDTAPSGVTFDADEPELTPAPAA